MGLWFGTANVFVVAFMPRPTPTPAGDKPPRYISSCAILGAFIPVRGPGHGAWGHANNAH